MNKNNLETARYFNKDNDINKNDLSNSSDNSEGDLSSDDSSFEKKAMQTARNIWRPKGEKKFETTSYELIKIKDWLKIYKYSNVERISNHDLIYQYYFDKFDDNEYKNANIILFIGKTGDGKTTAINAFFNIIKGIKREDKHRFVLIKEPKKEKGQAESQTDGLHLYYIKDKNNKPIIIIDSQGFGDTRGKEYDELILKAFEYAFTNIIDRINAVFFIAKSSDSRLDILTKYIFSCATSLFSEDISTNFIFLCTHADKSAFREGPLFIELINADNNFKKIINKMDKKNWYIVDSLSIFDDETDDRLCKYSFEQLYELYEEKIKNSKSKNISKSSEIISKRNDIKNIVKNIISQNKKKIPEKEKISEIEKKINECQNSINDIEYKIKNKRYEKDIIYVPDINDEISEIQRQEDNRIYDLEHQYRQEKVRQTEYYGGNNTYCTYCKNNCHNPCDCIGGLFNRCEIFSFFDQMCDRCGHHKDSHCVRSSYKYVDSYESVQIDNYSKIREEREYYQKRRDNAYNEYYRKKNQKEKCERELNDLNSQKNQFINKKNSYINDKQRTNENIEKINKEITIIIIDLINISKKIQNLAMNHFHIEIENEYIESLVERLEQIGIKDNSQIKKLKEFKRYNEIYQGLKDISTDDLILNGSEYFLNQIKLI